MNRSFVIVSLVVGTGTLAATMDSEPRGSSRSIEVARLKSHFDSVDAELKSRDVSRLTAAQRSRRATLTRWLRDYRHAGTFPLNDKLDAPAPYFRDSRGTLCAMAYLIDGSGRSDIVAKVEATRNNAYVAELADDAALIAWLDSSGLSVAEAARIQPAYRPGDGNQSDFNVSPVWMGVASLATSAVNVIKPSYASGVLGILAGAVSVGVAGKRIYDNGRTHNEDRAIIGLGALSFGAGVYGLIEARREGLGGARKSELSRGSSSMLMSVRVVPDFDVRRSDTRFGLR
nr:hypothetical protein [Gemmatimonadota bacterium]